MFGAAASGGSVFGGAAIGGGGVCFLEEVEAYWVRHPVEAPSLVVLHAVEVAV